MKRRAGITYIHAVELGIGCAAALVVFSQARKYFEPTPKVLEIVYDERETDAQGFKLASLKTLQGQRIFPLAGRNDQCLVVAMGQCGTCSTRPFIPGSEMPGKFAKVVLVYEGPSIGIPRQLKKLPRGNGFVVANDPTGSLHEKLRAHRTPRYYMTNAEGIIEGANDNRNEHVFFLK